MIADLWRWGLGRPDPAESDLERAWRQTVRWLVADVPERVEVNVERDGAGMGSRVDLAIRARDDRYLPLDNAKIEVEVIPPDGAEPLALQPRSDDSEPGLWRVGYVARDPGAHRAVVTVSSLDGTPIGRREVGWAAQPDAEEFARLEPDRAGLQRLATATGGEVVELDELDSFVGTLSRREAPITEPFTAPLWHTPLAFLSALACLGLEWGLRRTHAMA